MKKLIEWFDGSKWWHIVVVCGMTMFPGLILLSYVDSNGFTILPVFWGGMVYSSYLNKTNNL